MTSGHSSYFKARFRHVPKVNPISYSLPRIPDDRGLWQRAEPAAHGPGAPPLRLPRRRKRGPRHAQVPRHQGLRARRRQVLPREARQHRLPRLGGPRQGEEGQEGRRVCFIVCYPYITIYDPSISRQRNTLYCNKRWIYKSSFL